MDLFYILFNVHFDICIIKTFMLDSCSCIILNGVFKSIGLPIEHCFVQHNI